MTDQSIALPPSTGWFQVLHQIVDSGALARMHISAAALYIAIKRYVDHQTGFAEVSNDRLCKAMGVSKPTFYKARRSLQENGLITVVENHFPTRYVVHEQILYYAADRTPVASTMFQYIPSQLTTVLKALKSHPLTSDQLGTTVTIGTVNIQIVNAAAPIAVDKGQGR
ncbi:helix-turn-helix domain-containing protein [Azospirillum sp. RWY-5-1]|uniref:Helix-turn-helix domain-containing protein n=1 Tax=Azospirillum oleiclasticum TaxID=2735135 RepID=A0ABX2TMA4_9PROT|nr:helix-turn-helix domain-containing protein [Azospirillum oleiclasticum]NYZ16874.1 helix-turn-helix domain-containing protein [Azospirillum oleiclasticum]NYZ24393.1 helix-turn-helix domain-containing protein [Azospirillum oleiclasticum]